jgi:MFS family permease
MIIILYFLPIWFQVVESVSAIESGIRTLPLVLSLVFATIFAGRLVSKFGWYNPFFLICSVLTSIGAGMLISLKADSGKGAWIGYQILFGLGLGMGMQQSAVALQAALPKKDIPAGISLVFLGQNLGGAVLICIGQTLFNNDLLKGLGATPGVDPLIILRTGATDLRKVVPAAKVAAVLQAYNHALSKAFIVALAATCLSFVIGVGMPWINVKGLTEGGKAGIEKREKERAKKEEEERTISD